MARFALSCLSGKAYSVLSHEAIIDSAWDDFDQAFLLQRFPAPLHDDLRKAHAYAYGGAIIQDMGYYPFGSHLFSDLTHYVRSGDFVVNMLAEAQDLNEYAFALGSLAHYAADNTGHPIGVNKSVPMLYPENTPEIRRCATYEDNPADHLKTEFAFDVSQVAEHHYAPDAYHAFIGFEVSKPLAGARLRNDLRSSSEGCLKASRSRAGNLSLDGFHAHPRDDASRVEYEKKKQIRRDNPAS